MRRGSVRDATWRTQECADLRKSNRTPSRLTTRLRPRLWTRRSEGSRPSTGLPHSESVKDLGHNATHTRGSIAEQRRTVEQCDVGATPRAREPCTPLQSFNHF